MPPEERQAWEILAKEAREKLAARLADPEISNGLLAKIAELAADRAWGKPVQAVEADITERRPIVIDGAYGEIVGEATGVDPAP